MWGGGEENTSKTLRQCYFCCKKRYSYKLNPGNAQAQFQQDAKRKCGEKGTNQKKKRQKRNSRRGLRKYVGDTG